eukprot:scaffold223350_cov41-Attheya_sp.AAC.1
MRFPLLDLSLVSLVSQQRFIQHGNFPSGRKVWGISALKAGVSPIESSATAGPSVLCIGDALMDCIANNEARGWSVEKLMADESSWTAFPGGAPANVATALCKLGTSSAFCGCVGQDSDGDALETLLKQEGVNVSLMQRSTLYPTRRVMVTRSKTGDREFGAFHDHRNAHEFADTLLRYNSTATNNDDDDSSQFTRDLDAILSSTEWM